MLCFWRVRKQSQFKAKTTPKGVGDRLDNDGGENLPIFHFFVLPPP